METTRLVPETIQPLIRYCFPSSGMEASMMVLVTDSLARGYLPFIVSCHDHRGFGYSGCGNSGILNPSFRNIPPRFPQEPNSAFRMAIALERWTSSPYQVVCL